MSDNNFVRRNLKSRGLVKYKKPRSHREAQRRERELDAQAEAALLNSDSDEDKDRDRDKAGRASEFQCKGGLSSWGVDPLSLSLEWLKRRKTESGRAEVAVSDVTTTAIPTDTDAETAGQRLIRGLNVNASTAGHKSRKPVDFGDSRTYTPQLLSALEQVAPKCSGHHMPARLLTVNKSGRNKGRRFYGCTYPADQRCQYFLWAEDNPELLSVRFSVRGGGTASTSAGVVEAEKVITAPDFATKAYKNKLAGMSKDLLIGEILLFNRRISLCSTNPEFLSRKRLNVSGSKEEVLKRLITEASWWIAQHFKTKDSSSLSDIQILSNDACQLHTDDNSDYSESEDSESEDNISLSESDVETTTPNEDSPPKEMEEYSKIAGSGEDSMVVFSDSDSDSIVSSSQCKESAVEKSLLMRYFGFSSLRNGQLWAIRRVINGDRSLLVMPTGSGKSLSYVFPTLILPGLTIVVSPLIALMNDQLVKLPPELAGAAFTSSLSTHSSAELCHAVVYGLIKVLFVSPERLCSSAFRKLIRMLKENTSQSGFNPVSLVCVDEAHCLSQWSYNFRPSFLRIKREILFIQPQSVLALTATASAVVQQDIANHLNIDINTGILNVVYGRDNLQISSIVSLNEEDKHEKVLALLGLDRSVSRTSKADSPLTIIYVWRRADAEALGDFLKGVGAAVAVYHGGMASDQRDSVQRQFDRGNAKIIVATVAFGMGIDKADVRQIIHLSLPKSLESYMQEIGRAGRDGETARCTLLFSVDDVTSQHSLANSNRVAQFQLLGLLFLVFPFQEICRSQKDVSLRVKSVENLLDITASSAETVISLLELPPFSLVRLDRIHLDQIEGRFRITQDKLRSLQECDILVAGIIACNDNAKILQEKNKSELETRDQSSTYFPDERLSDALIHHHSHKRSLNGADIAHDTTICERFSLSRARLGQQTNLSLDEVSRGLYQLQRRGIIEYSLSENAIHIELTLDPLLSQQFVASPLHYVKWILSLSDRLFDATERIVNDNAEGVVKMWRIAHAVSTSVKSHGCDSADHIQRFLGRQLYKSSSCSDEVEGLEATLQKQFESAPSPWSPLRSQGNQSAIVDLTVSARRVVQDPSITGTLKRISSHCLQHIVAVVPGGSGAIPAEVKSKLTLLRSALVALLATKVLHGLTTKSIDSAYWASGILDGAFGSFRTFKFTDVQTEISLSLK